MIMVIEKRTVSRGSDLYFTYRVKVCSFCSRFLVKKNVCILKIDSFGRKKKKNNVMIYYKTIIIIVNDSDK